MTCRSRPQNLVRTIWNNGRNSSTEVFIPFVQLPVGAATRVRVSYLLQQATSTALQVKRALRYSDDGLTWGSPGAIGSYSNATTWQWGDEFLATEGDKRHVQVGMLVQRNAEGNFDFGLVALQVETLAGG